MFKLLYANQDGDACDHPEYSMLGRSGNQWVEPAAQEMIRLPRGSTLVSMPGRLAVGMDAHDVPRAVETDPYHRGIRSYALAALLPQGFTRTLLPATVAQGGTDELPLFGYTAVAVRGEQTYAAAVQTDEHRLWHPRFYNTEGLPGRINRTLRRFPENRLYRQLARCALQYSCFTAQNIFYQRWEGGIPSMPSCNAGCLGCISEKHGYAQAPQNRLDFIPSREELEQVVLEHLVKAPEAIASFGQGCEGEPSLNAPLLARVIEDVRSQTDRGTININSNAGFTKGIRKLCQAGLQALRVTIFSCLEDDYEHYHRPVGYGLKDVAASIRTAKDAGVYVSLNLLTFPGFTDRQSQVEELLKFVHFTGVDMIQFRNLNIDPDRLMAEFPSKEAGIGIVDLLYRLQSEAPGLRLGSYTHPHPQAKM